LAAAALIGCFGGVVFFGPPYLTTLTPQVSAALDLLDLRAGQTLLELGCGDGKVLIAAAELGLHVVGYELNPLLALLAWLRTRRYRGQVKVIWGDQWHKTWPPADGIFTFLLGRQMTRLDQRIQAWHTRPLTLASFAFQVPGRSQRRASRCLCLRIPLDNVSCHYILNSSIMSRHRANQDVLHRRMLSLARSVVIVVVFVIAGEVGFRAAHAASYATSAEAESGTISGNAAALSSSTASGGQAVHFGRPPSGGIAPPPGGSNGGGKPVASGGTGGGKPGGSTGGASPGYRYASIMEYPGWVQNHLAPNQIDYSPYTAIDHFGLWPTTTGGIAVGDMQSLSHLAPAVAAAHAHHRQIYMSVGEVRQGTDFAGAARPQYRQKFIDNIVSYVKKYNYDGVDIDWEEHVPDNQAEYITLLRGLRGALDQAFPGQHKVLGCDVDTGQIPPVIAAQVASSVDYMAMMAYWDTGASSFKAYRKAGIPASKLVLGIGLSAEYYDTTEARVQAKVKLMKSDGMEGLLGWQIGDLHGTNSDPRLDPLRALVRSAAP
jgi:SAM-dependent methyltransferase